MKTMYGDIVRKEYIGKPENPLLINEILKAAREENCPPSDCDKEKVLLVAVDVQQDFMDGGALGVSGASEDVAKLTSFIYSNLNKITKIAVSLDTHTPHQIFHQSWWSDRDGNFPAPFTLITLEDAENGLWRPNAESEKTLEYLKHLEADKKKTLCIWPYHCLQGTSGAALENQFANMAYFHSVARNSSLMRLVKGQQEVTEFYGIIKPEYDPEGYVNDYFISELAKYDKIVIAGEAKDYCVYETLVQMLELFAHDRETQEKIYILEDCMSAIQPKSVADDMYSFLASAGAIHLVKSTEDFL